MWHSLFALSIALPAAALGATTGLDDAFGTHGVVLFGPTASAGMLSAYGLTLQADGKIVVVGRTIDVGAQLMPAVGRLQPDGTWDATFGDNGVFLLQGSAAAPNGGVLHNAVVLSDGRLLVSGAAYNSLSDYRSCILLLELSSTGVPDTTFGPTQNGVFCLELGTPTTSMNHAEVLRLDSDDSFYVTLPTGSTAGHGVVGHFDATGAPVAGYGSGGIAALPAHAYGSQLQLMPNHAAIVLSIDVIDAATTTEGILSTALDGSGGIDASYGSGGSYGFDVAPSTFPAPQDVSTDAHGRLLVADDDYDVANFRNLPYRIARLTPGGALDPTFNPTGQQGGMAGLVQLDPSGYANSYDYLLSAKALPDRHILAIGDTASVTAGDGTSNIALLRLADDGSYDTAFGDAAHPGWASINLGGLSSSTAYVRASASDDAGRIYVLANTTDALGKGCMAILRVVPDRVFGGAFDSAAAFPNCP